MSEENLAERETLGGRLHQARLRKHLTLSALAAKVEVSATSIAAWENDTRKPHDGHAFKLADALEVNALWLIEGEGES